MSVGIKEVAKMAGVSIATVSRALNNEKYVNEELRKKILDIANKLNYEPNYMAKSLLKRKTNIIGVVVSDIATSFFSTILKSIERCASERNYNIMICNIDEDLEKEKKYLSVFKQMCVDGILLTHEQSDESLVAQLKAMSHIKMLACSCSIKDINCPSVNIDDFKASYDAIKYIYQCGHKKIAYIGSNLHEYTVGKRRFEGVKAAFLNYGIKDEYIKLSSLKLADGYKMTKEILNEHKNNMPTAIFAGSDELAVGALNCIIDFGYKVPDDIAIVGFDNSMISEHVRPSLTTVEQPIEEIGYFSVSMLIDMIENKIALNNNDIIFPHKIMERESCRKY